MPYANIETRRKYQRDAYQKKKLEYSEQRKQANQNINNELYNSLVIQRLEEQKQYKFNLKNEIKQELKELKNLDIETYNDPIKRDDRYNKIGFVEDDGTKELERHLKNNWVKRQVKELTQMTNDDFKKDNDIIKNGIFTNSIKRDGRNNDNP